MEVTHWVIAAAHAALQQMHSLLDRSLPDLARSTGEIALPWVHDISLAALAAAVMTLGLVMLLELCSLAQLRRSLEGNLARVFEQLDLLRLDSAQRPAPQADRSTGVAHQRHPRAAVAVTVAGRLDATAAPPTLTPAAGTPAGATLAAGEARLLASLAEARARRARAARASAANGSS